MDGGRVQQSAIGGVSSASSSMSVKSFGRSCTQTLSSLSTASPVTPPIFHLFGSGFGHSASTLYFGPFCVRALRAANKMTRHKPAATPKARRNLFLRMELPPYSQVIRILDLTYSVRKLIHPSLIPVNHVNI